MNDECTCPCHHSPLMVLHIAPCCMTCENCGKHIRYECWEEHSQRCHERVHSFQHQVAQKLADIEDVLVSALTFHVTPANWEGEPAKAIEDRGQVASQALKKVPPQG